MQAASWWVDSQSHGLWPARCHRPFELCISSCLPRRPFLALSAPYCQKPFWTHPSCTPPYVFRPQRQLVATQCLGPARRGNLLLSAWRWRPGSTAWRASADFGPNWRAYGLASEYVCLDKHAWAASLGSGWWVLMNWLYVCSRPRNQTWRSWEALDEANLNNAYRYWPSCSWSQIHSPGVYAPIIPEKILHFEFQIDLVLIRATIEENELPALQNLVIILTFNASTWNLSRHPVTSLILLHFLLPLWRVWFSKRCYSSWNEEGGWHTRYSFWCLLSCLISKPNFETWKHSRTDFHSMLHLYLNLRFRIHIHLQMLLIARTQA